MRIGFKNIICLLFLLAQFSLYSQNPKGFDDMATNMAGNSVPIIFTKQVNTLLANNKKIVFLDTREVEEYNVSHIKDAVFVGYNNLDEKKIDKIDKNVIVITYCSVGYRSCKVGEKLIKKGFNNVFNLYGGIFSWVNNGDIVYSNKKETKKVHPYDNKWGKWLRTEFWNKK